MTGSLIAQVSAVIAKRPSKLLRQAKSAPSQTLPAGHSALHEAIRRATSRSLSSNRLNPPPILRYSHQ